MTTHPFCYRHRPDLKEVRTETSSHENLYKELALLPTGDQQSIAKAWNTFSSAPAAQRRLILQGLLSTCCTSQLSFLATSIEPLLRIDFTSILPTEICIKIFSYLDAQSLCAACQVSQKWKAIADDDILWHRMCQQHIDKKCHKCGWGLPLLQKRRIIRLENNHEDSQHNTTMIVRKRSHDELTTPSSPPPTPKRADRKPWKQVYSERLVVERNWRKHRHTTRRLQQPEGVLCLQYCDAQNILITAGSLDGTATVWDLETGKVLRVLKGHSRSIRALQFDDTKLVTASMDHTLKIWNYHTGQCIRTLEGHTDGVVHLHFDSRILTSGSADGTVKIWNFETGQCFALTGHTDKVTHTQIYQHNKVVSASVDGTMRLWDLDTRSCLRVFRGHMGPVQVAIPGCLQQQEVIMSASLDRTIRIWSMETGKCIRTLLGHTDGVTTLAYDKLRLVSGSLDGTVKLWDVASGLPMYSLEEGDETAKSITSVKLSDAKVVSASHRGEIAIFDFSKVPPTTSPTTTTV
ncbi:WD40-repeat-containing domain protein [Phascolomyces articulosus]|uniref:WD40-repeat-containing domain protein n=1 Tax=Phascolomyces articulosus TaxID=60185 RepID=A0AAD5JQM8_9FUNG|nr:WD40-repeat-containing domain protein [Phascolomyces articulosus]